MSAYSEGRLFGRKTIGDVDALLNGPLFAGFWGVEDAITKALSDEGRILSVAIKAYIAFWLSIEGSQSLKLKGVRRTLIVIVFSFLQASLETGTTTYAEVAILVRVIAKKGRKILLVKCWDVEARNLRESSALGMWCMPRLTHATRSSWSSDSLEWNN